MNNNYHTYLYFLLKEKISTYSPIVKKDVNK
jgi:hypothetical protein